MKNLIKFNTRTHRGVPTMSFIDPAAIESITFFVEGKDDHIKIIDTANQSFTVTDSAQEIVKKLEDYIDFKDMDIAVHKEIKNGSNT